jgi:2-C-methyl-D-erythritol 2,4-cyclodiphosphate synthase
LSRHVAQMRANIAADLGIEPARVNVKATTTEKMGFVGRAEGIVAHAVVLLEE